MILLQNIYIQHTEHQWSVKWLIKRKVEVRNLLRDIEMPVHRARGPRGGKGWQYGTTGKVYPTRQQAAAQARAIKASQSRAKKK